MPCTMGTMRSSCQCDMKQAVLMQSTTVPESPLRSLRASVRAARRWLFPGLAWGALALLRLLAAVHTAAGVAFAAGCVGVGPYPVGLCVGAVWVRYWGACRSRRDVAGCVVQFAFVLFVLFLLSGVNLEANIGGGMPAGGGAIPAGGGAMHSTRPTSPSGGLDSWGCKLQPSRFLHALGPPRPQAYMVCVNWLPLVLRPQRCKRK